MLATHSGKQQYKQDSWQYFITVQKSEIVPYYQLSSYAFFPLWTFFFSPLEFIAGHLNFAKIATNFNKRESQSFQQ